MDTTTVLEIIKMIDNKVKSLRKGIDEIFPEGVSLQETAWARGHIDGLENFANHLQSFIEAQLNAEETKSTEQ